MNPLAMTIINPRKEYWLSWGSNQRPPVLRYATLPTELWGLSPRLSTTLILRIVENIVGKGENAINQHRLLFSERFLHFQNQSHLSSANAFNLDQSKILSFGKEGSRDKAYTLLPLSPQS